MDLIISKIRQNAIGSIIFGTLILIASIFFMLGQFKVFLTDYNPLVDTISDIFVIKNVKGIYSSYLSYVVSIISFLKIITFSLFLLFFNFRLYISCSDIDRKIDIRFKKFSLINFISLCFGSIFILATCNALLNNRKDNEYISETTFLE